MRLDYTLFTNQPFITNLGNEIFAIASNMTRERQGLGKSRNGGTFMHFKTTMTLLCTAATLTPFMVQPASADGCNSKLIRTSYKRISPRTVKETMIFEKTRLISKATPARHFRRQTTCVHRTAYLAPRHTFTTTTRTTSMFIPTSSLVAPVAVVKPVVVAPTTTTIVRRSAFIAPTTTVVRASAIIPGPALTEADLIPRSEVIRAAELAPSCTMIKTQSVVTPVVGSTDIIAAPGQTVILKEKHGKLKQVGTLTPTLWY